ncbi:RNA polymerase factor sigma-54 [Persephonella sp.]
MLKQTLNLRLQNKLVLTLSLKQQLSLLLLPSLELKETIKQELEENPFLEEIINIEPDHEPIKDLSKYYDEEESPLINRIAYKPTLNDMLDFQIDLEFEGIEKDIAHEIAGNLDDKGLLAISVEEIASKFGVSPEMVETVRKKFTRLEPTGVGSKTIEEALLVQYEEKFGKDELVEKILKEDIWRLNDLRYLSEKYKVDKDELEEVVFYIKMLKPYPTLNYQSEITEYVEPDVYVYDKGDRFEIKINEAGIPKLKLTSQYKKLISDKSLSPEIRKFLEDKLQKAIGIMKGIELRRENLYKITELLVNYQADFLRKGKEYLKPLTLKDIASKLGLHESTVSRIVSSKYMQTDQGLIPLKAFFVSRLQSTSGDISTEKVKYMISEIIEKEDKKKPLSDQAIANILKERYGIKIARRTVTKYREELNIPDSRTRRIKP